MLLVITIGVLGWVVAVAVIVYSAHGHLPTTLKTDPFAIMISILVTIIAIPVTLVVLPTAVILGLGVRSWDYVRKKKS